MIGISFQEPDELFTLMQKKEPLCDELKPYVARNRSFNFISHPLIQEVPFIDPERCALINLRFEQKKKQLAIAKATGSWHTYVYLHERPYRFNAMMELFDLGLVEGDKAKAELIGSVWIDSENIWQHQRQWKKLWSSLKQPQLAMDDDDLTPFKALPDMLEVWRGVRFKSNNPNGLSWTLDRDKAIWFAKRFTGGTPTLFSGMVKKEKVFAYFTGRSEQEIVVDPANIMYRKSQGGIEI